MSIVGNGYALCETVNGQRKPLLTLKRKYGKSKNIVDSEDEEFDC
jgi:hypothetical protein